MHGIVGQSNFTKSIVELVAMIDGKSPLKDSLFEQAKEYFDALDENNKRLNNLFSKAKEAEDALAKSSTRSKEQKTLALKKSKKAYLLEKERQQNERLARLQKVMTVCEKIIRICESENWEKTQIASARVLGTLYLICPNQGNNVQREKQRFKPIYKAVLAIRLLDKLLNDDQIVLDYIRNRFSPHKRYCDTASELRPFHLDVVIPVIIAAIFQDIGLQHPETQAILVGEDGQEDSFKVLDKASRIKLLKLNHKYTLDYLKNGLGASVYVGNSKSERDKFEKKQHQHLLLAKELITGALNPKLGVGNIIKLPQIYSSFIFSYKEGQTLFDLPKAGLLLNKSAASASISKTVVKAFIDILGHFPQGYGIVYIAENPDGSFSDSYEYAIVTELNPKDPFKPTCRKATKHLQFISNGAAITISTKQNLYYPEPKKMLEKIDPERLKQILQKLASNYEERKDIDLIPSFWDPHEFFQYQKMQNLWKST